MKRIFSLFFCLIIFSLLGCKKFLNVKTSSNTLNPTTISDFEEILNSDSIAICNFLLADLMSDDIQFTDSYLSADTSSFYVRSYLWEASVWNPGDVDIMYNRAYERILQMNVVLSKIENVNASTQQKNIVQAQAEINRAWYYLQLVNLYSSDYQQTTAATDLAVPLILTPDPSELPARATVQQVYNQILQDLNDAVAVADLPIMGKTIVQPGKAAGYALLARTYLYMGNYTKAQVSADSALEMHDSLSNYNGGTQPISLIDLSHNPETLFGKLCDDNIFTYYNLILPPSLYILFGTNDARLQYNFTLSSYSPKYDAYKSNFYNYSVAVPEMMLIKAECLARNGDAAGALSLINQLRQNRLIQYTALTDTTDILTTVLQERRRELLLHGGLRLFDLKRLNKDSKYAKTLQRVAFVSGPYDYGDTLATLAPNSQRYLMPFSPLVIANNPNMIQNPR